MTKPRHPFTALPDNLFGILEGYEWAVMMALAYHGYSSYPSQRRIAELAGISLTTTQKTLSSLREKGLVDWDSRKRPDGGQGSNLYKLTIDHLWNPEGVSATRVPSHVQETDPPTREAPTPHPRDGYPPTRDAGTPHPRGTDQEQDLKEPDLKELIPPVVPPPLTRGTKSENVLRVKVIPPELQPFRNEILTFWDEHKGGQKTQRAWDIQMSDLLKILNDPKGGGKAILEQLEKAATAAIHKGKPWLAIGYGNWKKYNADNNSTTVKGYTPKDRPGPPIERLTVEQLRKMQGL